MTREQQRKIWRRSIILMIASGFVIVAQAALFVVTAQAQEAQGDLSDITQEKIELVRDNCVAAQVAIQRQQNSDVVVRTNRGRSYENILKLMAAFNARVANNKLTEPRLIESTGIMQRDVTAFYHHYDAYKDTIETILRLKCTEQPVTFYRNLQTLRGQRDTLRSDVVLLDKHVADYRGLVADLRSRLANNASGPAE